MKRFFSAFLGVMFLTVCMTVSGFGRPAGKDMAIGYDGIVNGISFKKFVSKDLGFQGILGFGYESAPSNSVSPNNETSLDYSLAARVIMPKDITEKIKLNCFGGIALNHTGSHTKDVGQTNLYIESGLSPEIFLFNNLSVETSLGIRLGFIGETADGVDNGYTSLRTFGAGVSIVDGVSFHYYF